MLTEPFAPTLTRRLAGGTQAIARIVDEVLGCGEPSFAVPRLTRELLAMAMNEVLHTVTEVAGAQREADGSSVDLWVGQRLVIVTACFHGAPLPDWLLVNWDRGQEPALLAPRTEFGWGWLLVREAFDAVWRDRAGDRQLLFLEKRI